MSRDDVKAYDVVVIGSGSGATIVDNALYQGLSVGWIDRGPVGGTCLNVGCIPSKVMIFPADRAMEIRAAGRLGVGAEITDVDFGAIMARTRRMVNQSRRQIREGIEAPENLDFYEMEGHFVDGEGLERPSRTLAVGDKLISGRHVFIVSGARPRIPPIKGLDEVPYLTNETILDLKERPESLVIVGGGYISAEYAHFFSAMGTRVTVVQRNEYLVPDEEPEISELLQEKLSERMDVYTGTAVVEVIGEGAGVRVVAEGVEDGDRREVGAERVMVAAGRRSNADLLKVENAGIETDEAGYIKVNQFLETNMPNVWAFGDATGKHMFKHVANREASIVWHNFAHEHKAPMDYGAVPHAVFSHPQIASVGLTEAKAKEEYDILVGGARYLDVAKGQAMMETDGFAKSIIERDSGRILGFHLIGPYAPILIQEVVNVMANEGTAEWVARGMHIHPALPEVVVKALYNVREPL